MSYYVFWCMMFLFLVLPVTAIVFALIGISITLRKIEEKIK